LTNTPDAPEEVETFSPDARRVAFVRNNDLFVVDIPSQTERRLTSDGSATILNGVLDWVYDEEVYGRGSRRALWWSPDSARIAFLRLDESPVRAFTLLDHLPGCRTRKPRSTTPRPATRTRSHNWAWCAFPIRLPPPRRRRRVS
jgi:dipeptidyl-peptidase-4